MKAQQIRKRYETLVNDRRTADQTYDIISKFVVPFRGEFFRPMTTEHEVNWREGRFKFDDTAVFAAEMLSSAMQADLTNPATKWFNIGFRDKILMRDEDVKEWIQGAEDVMYKELQESNFDLEAAEFYTDLVSFGSGVIIEEAASEINWEGLSFKALMLRETQFEEDFNGNIGTLYRLIQWTASQIVQKFEEDKVPQNIKSAAEAGNQGKIDIIFCVYPRKEKQNADVRRMLNPEDRPYGYKYVLRSGGTDEQSVLEEGGYYDMPAFITRWRKVSGSKFGYSPAHVCLSDILSTNQLVEETFEALGKVIDPSTIVTKRGLLSDLDLGRGGLTVARSKDDIWSYESKARFDVGEVKLERLQASINRAFHVDQLMLKESPAMTATEAQIRYRLMQRLLGPTLGRLMHDFLDPLIKRTFNILYRAGQFGDVPEQIPPNAVLNIEYTGPLAQAQKMAELQSTQNWMAQLQQMSEAWPEVLDWVDADAVANGTADSAGVPHIYVRGEKGKGSVKEIRDQRQAQREAEQQLMQADAAGQAAKSMGEGITSLDEARGGKK